ncbi:MAG: putative toxin-antitoxin system toxin component, PIN family [Myxococcota bacterium]
MRVVLDSNVLVAALAAHGTCAELFEYVLADHEFAIDDNLVGEVERVLRDKIRVPVDRIEAFTRLLRRRGVLLDAAPPSEPACRDPDDDRILALCRAFEADILVTGDKDLLVLDPWEGMGIVPPRDFWSFERRT